jgi:hypothetical protein
VCEEIAAAAAKTFAAGITLKFHQKHNKRNKNVNKTNK